MNRKTLKMLQFSLWGAFGVIVGLSFAVSIQVGWGYGAQASFATYSAMFRGLAFVLGALLVAAILSKHHLDWKVSGIENRLLEYLRTRLGWQVDRWDESLEKRVESELSQGGVGTDTSFITEALAEKKEALGKKRDLIQLVAGPVGMLSVILVISAWAIPANEVFLQMSAPGLNTMFMFLVSYGSLIAIASTVVSSIALVTD